MRQSSIERQHENNKNAYARESAEKMLRFHELTPEPRSFDFLRSTFEVAVPPKPYYNPVNLWKARREVKKKESIRAIGFARA